MATQQERAEHAMSVLMRLGTSLIMPAWGIVTLIVGLWRGSIAWILTGAAVLAIGAMLLAASPLAERALDIRESWRLDPPKKS